MTDTLLTVECEENVTCTALGVQPGATIVSPILLSLSGVTGQIWALYYLYTSTRPQHSRTVFFVLLSTLIWTDLVGKIITTTPALVAYAHGTWVGGVPMCNLHGFSMMLISLVTHLLVSTMAVERFIGIRHGYFYNKNITTSRTKMLLLGMWLFSVLFCALPLFGVGQYALQYPGSWCYVNIHVGSATPLRHRVFTNVFGSFTLASLLVMVACNLVVITTLLCLRLCRERCCSTNQLCAPHRASRQRELEMQMVVVLLVITIVFVLSWSPIDMRLFLNQIWPHQTRDDHIVDLIAVRLTSINQIVDPWAYIICRKVFMMRAWRWMRLSLMGSRLDRLGGRETSSRPLGSQKKAAPTPARSSERYRYRTPFRGSGGGAELDMALSVVAMEEEVDAHHHLHHNHHHHHHHHHSSLSPPAPPSPTPLSKESLTRELQPKDVVEIFKDSGTGSNITPSTFCSDSGEGICNHTCLAGGGAATQGLLGTEPLQQEAVPIPVFTCGQYRVVPPAELRLPRRLKRITSSASARAAPSARPPRHAHNPDDTGRDSWLPLVVKGRRHSWCCPLDELETKQYRTRSTQTFKHHDLDDDDHHHGGDDDPAPLLLEVAVGRTTTPTTGTTVGFPPATTATTTAQSTT
ncbi:prostaglandin E2 receptor EP4 subtype-like isoform X2 [Panulirus ornatus]|uniref:prostaglandin E2 receptor EP4 subtype-like isoform X2 n=1 Tax=Panulirus ornatus TaxID=150431 RepID=UPI003A8B1443